MRATASVKEGFTSWTMLKPSCVSSVGFNSVANRHANDAQMAGVAHADRSNCGICTNEGTAREASPKLQAVQHFLEQIQFALLLSIEAEACLHPL